jgi:DnaJ family protein C protein 9
MEEIPHSQYTDEARFIKSINSLIDSNTLKATPTWKKTSTDDKASKKRAEKAIKSAQEAESHAKELGIWDEMFGTGKKGKRKSDAKDEGEDGLAALILRRQKDREGGLDRLAEKYRKIEEEERAKKVKGKKGKGKGKVQKDEGGGPPVCTCRGMS